MTRRTERVASVIREAIGRVLLTKLSDPRIDPARTSVTRVEVPEDLLTARVYVSVIGSDAEVRKVLRALQHAAGHVQELLGEAITLRHTPILSFDLDTRYKKTLQTLDIIERAMEEIRRKEADSSVAAGDVGHDAPQQEQPQEPAME